MFGGQTFSNIALTLPNGLYRLNFGIDSSLSKSVVVSGFYAILPDGNDYKSDTELRFGD